MLAALVALGYDRSFEQPPTSPGRPAEPGPAGWPAGRRSPTWEQIELFPTVRGVVLAPGTSIEPGGIGKGLAADLVAGELLAAGATGVAVDIGGDVCVGGTNPETGEWCIDVADPRRDDGRLLTFSLPRGSVATSSPLRRRWTNGGVERHHLLDPRTRMPLQSSLLSVTVVATEGWWAEALTKAVFVRGLALLDEGLPGAHGIVVDTSGQVHTSALAELAA
jgi:thiamine biosynthesis lipoprotein